MISVKRGDILLHKQSKIIAEVENVSKSKRVRIWVLACNMSRYSPLDLVLVQDLFCGVTEKVLLRSWKKISKIEQALYMEF